METHPSLPHKLAASRHSGDTLDALACALLFGLIATPYRSALQVDVLGATIALEEALAISLLAAAVARLITQCTTKVLRELVGLLSIVALMLSLQWISPKFTLNREAVNHARLFIHFFAAAFVIIAPWRTSRYAIVTVVFAATLVSATLAITAHLVARERLGVFAGENDSVALAQETGRMLWHRGDVAILAPLVLIATPRRYALASISGLLFILCALLLTQNRTVLVGFFASLATSIAVVNRKRRGLIVAVVVGGVCAIGVVTALMDEPERQLFAERLGITDADAEIDRSLVRFRLPLYEQYFAQLGEAPITGIGLGSPLAVLDTGAEAWSADVSILHVMVPFGISGAVLLVWMVATCYRHLAFAKDSDAHAAACKWLVLIALLISLNFDVWFRNTFAVAFAFILAGRNGAGVPHPVSETS